MGHIHHRRNQFLAGVLGAVALAGLATLCLRSHGHQIPKDISARAGVVLETVGLDPARLLSVDGRDIILHGEVDRMVDRDPTPAPGESQRAAWNFVNIEQIGKQVSYPLLGAYIQQAPNPAWTGLPYRTQPEIEITEGPHMSYALQWFTFAELLGIGYPFFIRRQEHRTEHVQREAAAYN